MKVVQHLDEELWRNFVDTHPQGNIFHTPEMFRVFARVKGHRPVLWVVIDDNNRPLALLPTVEVTLMDGLLRRLTTRAIAYGSILCVTGSHRQKVLTLLFRTYKKETKRHLLFTEFRNLSNMAEIQPILTEHGFCYEDHLNYLIDLSRPPEQILQSIGKRTRKLIRKGLRDNMVEMSEVTNRAELGEWYKTLKKTYVYSQVPLADHSLFEAAFEELHPKQMAKFLLAKVDGKIAACSVELPLKDAMYGWYGGSDREYSRYLPNELLIWHILEWGAGNGYRVYDFGGAGKPDEEYGVRNFKAKFNGELVCFGRNTLVHSETLFKFSTIGYQLYRRFIR